MSIIHQATEFITEDFVRFSNLLERRKCGLVVAKNRKALLTLLVWMKLQDELLVGLPNLICRCVRQHSQDLVEIPSGRCSRRHRYFMKKERTMKEIASHEARRRVVGSSGVGLDDWKRQLDHLTCSLFGFTYEPASLRGAPWCSSLRFPRHRRPFCHRQCVTQVAHGAPS